MNAQEAREKSEKYNEEKSFSVNMEIEEAVKHSVSQGKFDAVIYSRPSKKVWKELSEKGFHLSESDSQKEGFCLKISW